MHIEFGSGAYEAFDRALSRLTGLIVKVQPGMAGEPFGASFNGEVVNNHCFVPVSNAGEPTGEQARVITDIYSIHVY